MPAYPEEIEAAEHEGDQRRADKIVGALYRSDPAVQQEEAQRDRKQPYEDDRLLTVSSIHVASPNGQRADPPTNHREPDRGPPERHHDKTGEHYGDSTRSEYRLAHIHDVNTITERGQG
jgi:hypothetical protein